MLTVKEAPVLSLDFTTNMKQLLNLIKQTKTYVFTQEKKQRKDILEIRMKKKLWKKNQGQKGN